MIAHAIFHSKMKYSLKQHLFQRICVYTNIELMNRNKNQYNHINSYYSQGKKKTAVSVNVTLSGAGSAGGTTIYLIIKDSDGKTIYSDATNNGTGRSMSYTIQ